ncbi:MAG: SH3 domain-containing protein [Burkholderiaceae bacterium]|nr:SH3 domain-containing protein [Burkholderiaceae bacterium]
MSKHKNYRGYYNHNRNNTNPVFNNVEKQNDVIVEEPVINDAETIVDEPQVAVFKLGVVSNCQRLNVRENPTANAKVVCVIELDDEVEVDKQNSTDDFYKVVTADGTDGFCMKKFITLQ